MYLTINSQEQRQIDSAIEKKVDGLIPADYLHGLVQANVNGILKWLNDYDRIKVTPKERRAINYE